MRRKDSKALRDSSRWKLKNDHGTAKATVRGVAGVVSKEEKRAGVERRGYPKPQMQAVQKALCSFFVFSYLAILLSPDL